MMIRLCVYDICYDVITLDACMLMSNFIHDRHLEPHNMLMSNGFHDRHLSHKSKYEALNRHDDESTLCDDFVC